MTLLALQREFRSWLLTESLEMPGQLGKQARAGLAVYLNNYRSQLMSCLSASFSVTRAWLGDAAFEGAAAQHIDRAPPCNWTLDAYGLDFPDTLESLFPMDAEVAELAGLERELMRAFVGADADPVDARTLADIDWNCAVFRLAPTFSVLPITMNVAAIWSAINAGEKPPTAARLPEPAALAVWREGFTPRFRTTTLEEAELLAQVRDGKSFGGVCETLVARLGEVQGAAAAGAFLGQWLSEGLIVGITA